jgi:hypothetical protein
LFVTEHLLDWSHCSKWFALPFLFFHSSTEDVVFYSLKTKYG